MANYKRKRPRTCPTRGAKGSFPNGSPRWWDIVFHTRPRRRTDDRVSGDIRRGVLDPDAALWHAGRKPHKYYW